MTWTTEQKFRGCPGDEPAQLNKITGCESRTVPPLYVPYRALLTKVSHWGRPWEGRARLVDPSHEKHESEDLRNGLFLFSARLGGSAFVAEKRLRRHD